MIQPEISMKLVRDVSKMEGTQYESNNLGSKPRHREVLSDRTVLGTLWEELLIGKLLWELHPLKGFFCWFVPLVEKPKQWNTSAGYYGNVNSVRHTTRKFCRTNHHETFPIRPNVLEHSLHTLALWLDVSSLQKLVHLHRKISISRCAKLYSRLPSAKSICSQKLVHWFHRVLHLLGVNTAIKKFN